VEIETIGTPILWVGFTFFVLGMLALDLGVFHRDAHQLSVREALGWTTVWISLALLFNLGVYFWFGSERALEFLTGYMIEKALSVDNIFVFLVIFSAFSVPPKFQHLALFWGVLGALVMRAIFIVLGAALLHRFYWVAYLFGVFLVFTGVKLMMQRGGESAPRGNRVYRLFRRLIPLMDDYGAGRFTVVNAGKRYTTPLLAIIVAIGYRHRFRGRLNSRNFCGSEGSLHRVHVERFRHAWTAGALLRARGHDGEVPLPQGRSVTRAGERRR
jgi:tellurite resistance protein TerC